MLHTLTRTVLALALAIAPVLPATAQDDNIGWVNGDGAALPDTDTRKSSGGFGGMLVVTPDTDWETKWRARDKQKPRFTAADKVKVGEVLTILPLFTNPKLDDKGYARIRCDLRVLRPDGSVSVEQNNLDCFTYNFAGTGVNLRGIFKTVVVPTYIGEAEDPRGDWEVDLTLRDVVRGVEVPLTTTFTLLPE